MGATTGGDVSSFQLILTSILPFILVFIVIYFLILRPQKINQNQREEMLKSLKKGDKVVTQGGIVAVVFGFKEEDIVVLKIGESSKINMLRSHIVSLFS